MESILETQAATILEFFAGLRGTLWVTFEEGTWAAWLYDLLKPHVAKFGGRIKGRGQQCGVRYTLPVQRQGFNSPSALQVFSGEANYRTRPVKVWEQPSDFYCPVIASLVAGGSHLFCATLERTVRDMGGHIAAMDTDSAMIVSTKNGGFIPCAGGPDRLKNYTMPSGHSAIRALSFADWIVSVSSLNR